MTTALLIGFHYSSTPQWSPLISTDADLKAMSLWCETWVDHCSVVSDQHALSKSSFIDYLTSFKLTTSRLLVYYTGHGLPHQWVLPSGEVIGTSEIREIVCNWLSEDSEVVWLIDCCSPTHFNLPFKLHNNTWELQLSDDTGYLINPWLVIISANGSEKSVATNKGSLFTQSWLNYLSVEITDTKGVKARSINLRRLMGTIASEIYSRGKSSYQTVSIYSSYIIDPILWMWIGTDLKSGTDEVVSDPSQSLLVIRKSSVPPALVSTNL